MVKALIRGSETLAAVSAILVILAALMACGDEAPTPRGAEATVPATTEAAATQPSPTASASEPTAVRRSTPTSTSGAAAATAPSPANSPTPEQTATPAPPGILIPLQLQDSVAMLSELSDTELACIGGDPGKLARSFTGQGPASREGQAKLLGCLEDETIDRIFLAGFVPSPRPLNLETSDCVRAAFAVIDPRVVMTAGIEGNPGRAMAGSIAALSVTVACLTDQEWQETAPMLGMSPDERAGMQCLMEALGGPGPMATAMTAAQEGEFAELASRGGGVRAGDGTPARAAARHSSTDAHGAHGSGHAGPDNDDTRVHTDRDANDGHAHAGTNTGDHPGDHCRRDTRRHPRVQQVRVETLDGRRRRLPGRPAGGPHRRVSAPSDVQDRPGVQSGSRQMVRGLHRGLFRGPRGRGRRPYGPPEERPQLRRVGLEPGHERGVRQQPGRRRPPDSGPRQRQPLEGRPGGRRSGSPGTRPTGASTPRTGRK